jgi:hypothetical protein
MSGDVPMLLVDDDRGTLESNPLARAALAATDLRADPPPPDVRAGF